MALLFEGRIRLWRQEVIDGSGWKLSVCMSILIHGKGISELDLVLEGFHQIASGAVTA